MDNNISVTSWLRESVTGDRVVLLGTAVQPVHTSKILTAARRLDIKVATQKCHLFIPDKNIPVTLNALLVTRES